MNELSSQNFMLKNKNNDLQAEVVKLKEERDKLKERYEELERDFNTTN